MSESRGILAPRRVWSELEVAELRRRYPNERAADIAASMGIGTAIVHKKAYVLRLRKSEAFNRSAASGRLDGERGSDSRFKPGNVPWTFGKKGLVLSPKTMFKTGHEPINRQQVGALRINSDGDLDIKVRDGLRSWVCLRRLTWEMANGPLPEGALVVPRDGDLHNTQLHNLELLTRQEFATRHLHTKYPPALLAALKLRTRLETQVKKLQGSKK